MKKVIIIGAGPAGLTAGYELLKKSESCDAERDAVNDGLCTE